MPQRFIAIFPSFPYFDPILQLRAQFDPLAALVAPHLTLVFPFIGDLTDVDLKKHIETAIEGVPSFPVRLQGITGYGDEYLFLNVKRGNDPLVDLHDRLYTGPLQPYLAREHTFVPHLTVGRLRDRSAFQAALDAASLLTGVFETEVREIAVCTIRDDGSSPADFLVPLARRESGLRFPEQWHSE